MKENKIKDLIIVRCYQFDNEMIAVKHHHARVDKADENSQSLETYDAMRRTTESERVSARRKIRPGSRSTSTHATEDDDIVEFSPGSLKSGSWKDRRLRPKC